MHEFLGIASQAVASEECIKLVDDALKNLKKQVEDKAPTTTCRTEAISQEPDICLQTACLKKKEIQQKTSKRKKSWLDNQHPSKKKKGAAKVIPEKQSSSRGEKYIPVAQCEAPTEKMTGTNADGLRDYGYYARLLTSEADDIWDLEKNPYFPPI
uniref:Uncharacterized protein n=1 Tax=Triticum urartu TaxID=4572 RepID=A0A8R7TU24_TRIUA